MISKLKIVYSIFVHQSATVIQDRCFHIDNYEYSTFVIKVLQKFVITFVINWIYTISPTHATLSIIKNKGDKNENIIKIGQCIVPSYPNIISAHPFIYFFF